MFKLKTNRVIFSFSNQYKLYLYTRYIINIISSYYLTLISLPLKPTLISDDVIIIILTIYKKDNIYL
jgi:hypothetical protein